MFLRRHIDRAIVMTQYDLRGFASPVGARTQSNKGFYFIPGNFLGFAANVGGECTVEPYVNSSDLPPFEDLVGMCRQLASDCDESEREAIQLIVLDIVRQSEERKGRVASGQSEPSRYLVPLEKGNSWGRTVLALVEAFEVSLKQSAVET